jgi:hypothetical protein
MFEERGMQSKSLYLSPAGAIQGSPTSTVSTSKNSTSTIFSAIGIKFVLVEFLELAM